MDLIPKEWKIVADAAGINIWLALGLGFFAFALVDMAKRPLGLTGKGVFLLTWATAITLSLAIVFLQILDTDLQITPRIAVRGVLRSFITGAVAIGSAYVRRNLPDKRKGKDTETDEPDTTTTEQEPKQ